MMKKLKSILPAVIIVVLVCIIIGLVINRPEIKVPSNPETNPVGGPVNSENKDTDTLDENLEDGETELTEKPVDIDVNNKNQGTGLSITYTDKLRILPGESTASIMFKNPSSSAYAITLSVELTDSSVLGLNISGLSINEGTGRYIVAKSGILNPGEGLDSIELIGMSNTSSFTPGTYEAFYWVELYNTSTNEKVALNTQIPIDFIVLE